MSRDRLFRMVMVGVLIVAGCTPSKVVAPDRTVAPRATVAQTALPTDAVTVVNVDSAAELALATSRALYLRSPAVVLVGEADTENLPSAMNAAVNLGVPLLMTPNGVPTPSVTGPSPGLPADPHVPDLRAELKRLAVSTVVALGSPAAQWANAEVAALGDGVAVLANMADAAKLATIAPRTPLSDLLVLALDDASSMAATATARAAGAQVVLMPHPDPRTSDAVIKQLVGTPTIHVLALGQVFGPADRLLQRVRTAATGVQLPGGGQVVFPGRRIVALYGHPGDPRLGVLGEQSATAAVTRARQVARDYQALVSDPVVPAFEVIATVASSGPGSDGNYSSESTLAHLRPWVDAASNAGLYVLLDLQPGRTDFLTQAKLYTELLLHPNVGLALDPEWRLKPGQRHLQQIGSVSAEEINQTATWLANLVREHHLPQKILMLHQFRLDMITNRPALRTDFDELAIVIHADGFGTPGEKFNTWRALHTDAPTNVFWGWKNFYDEDRPTFTPRQTFAVSPSPVVVTYQ